VDGKRIALILDKELIQKINNYRRNHPDMPSMSEAIRDLLRECLDTLYSGDPEG
jgi:metal-responsive CopG/Arc/MetJ family transcriptional regulator